MAIGQMMRATTSQMQRSPGMSGLLRNIVHASPQHSTRRANAISRIGDSSVVSVRRCQGMNDLLRSIVTVAGAQSKRSSADVDVTVVRRCAGVSSLLRSIIKAAGQQSIVDVERSSVTHVRRCSGVDALLKSAVLLAREQSKHTGRHAKNSALLCASDDEDVLDPRDQHYMFGLIPDTTSSLLVAKAV